MSFCESNTLCLSNPLFMTCQDNLASKVLLDLVKEGGTQFYDGTALPVHPCNSPARPSRLSVCPSVRLILLAKMRTMLNFLLHTLFKRWQV
jgi:hypothetical protein